MREKNKVRKGDVYIADFGPKEEDSSVQAGRRFGVIVQNDIGNKYSTTTLVCPITSNTEKNPLPTHVSIEKGLPLSSIALIEQHKTFEQRDLEGPFYKFNKEEMKKLDKALRVSFGIK